MVDQQTQQTENDFELVPRAKLDFHDRYTLLLEELEKNFDRLFLSKSLGDFHVEIFEKVCLSKVWDQEEPAEIIRNHFGVEAHSKSSEELLHHALAGIILAATYCVRGRIKYDYGHIDAGWGYMTEAWLYSGIVLSGQIAELTYSHEIALVKKEAVSAFSVKGHKGRRKVSDKFAEEAYRLVRDRKPVEGKWLKIIDAVLNIQADMIEYSRRENIRAAPSNIQRRLSELLSRMPDVTELFQSKE